MKKHSLLIAIFLLIIILGLLLVACNKNNNVEPQSSTTGSNDDLLQVVYAAYLDSVGDGEKLSYEEWIASIKGINGENGKDGLSAFEIYKKYNPSYMGTEQDWINSLGNSGNSYDDILGGTIEYALNEDATAYYVAKYTGYDRYIEIPSTYKGKPVTKILSRAFYQCSNISTIIIPDTIKEIEYRAFYETYLTKVILGNGVEIIDDNAFDYIDSSKALYEKDGLLYLGNEQNKYIYLFRVTENATECIIDPSCKICKSNVFVNNTKLKKIELSNNITSLPSFSGCTSLEQITIPNSIERIESSAFSNCTSLTNISLPNSLSYIGTNAFSNCTSLTNISLPNSLTYIDESAFTTSNVSYTEYNNLKFLGNGENPYLYLADYVNDSTDTYNIPSQTKLIQLSALLNTSITNLYLSENVIFIGRDNYYSYPNLLTTLIVDSEECASQILFNAYRSTMFYGEYDFSVYIKDSIEIDYNNYGYSFYDVMSEKQVISDKVGYKKFLFEARS